MAEQKPLAARAFVIAGILFLIAAVIPVLREETSNPAFAGVGCALFVIGLAMARKMPAPPRDIDG